MYLVLLRINCEIIKFRGVLIYVDFMTFLDHEFTCHQINVFNKRYPQAKNLPLRTIRVEPRKLDTAKVNHFTLWSCLFLEHKN